MAEIPFTKEQEAERQKRLLDPRYRTKVADSSAPNYRKNMTSERIKQMQLAAEREREYRKYLLQQQKTGEKVSRTFQPTSPLGLPYTITGPASAVHFNDAQLKAGRSSGDYFPSGPPGTQRIINQVETNPAIPSWLYDNPLANWQMAPGDLSHIGIESTTEKSPSVAVQTQLGDVNQLLRASHPTTVGGGQVTGGGQPTGGGQVTGGGGQAASGVGGSPQATDTDVVVESTGGDGQPSDGLGSPFAGGSIGALGSNQAQNIAFTPIAGNAGSIATGNTAPKVGMYDRALDNLKLEDIKDMPQAQVQTPSGEAGKLSRLFSLFKDPSFQRFAGTGLIAAFGGPGRGREAETFNTIMDKNVAFDLQQKKFEQEKADQIDARRHRDNVYDIQKRQENRAAKRAQTEVEESKYAAQATLMEAARKQGWTPEHLAGIASNRGFNQEDVESMVENQVQELNSGKYVELRNPNSGEITGYRLETDALAVEGAKSTLRTEKMEANELIREEVRGRLGGFIRTKLTQAQEEKREITAEDLNYNTLIPADTLTSDGRNLRDVFTPGNFLTYIADVTDLHKDKISARTRIKIQNDATLMGLKLDRLRIKMLEDERNSKGAYPFKEYSDGSKNRLYDDMELISGVSNIETALDALVDKMNSEAPVGEEPWTRESVLKEVTGAEGWLKGKISDLEGPTQAFRYLFDFDEFNVFRASVTTLVNSAIARLSGTAVSNQELIRNLTSLANIEDRPGGFMGKLYQMRNRAMQDIRNVARVNGAKNPSEALQYLLQTHKLPSNLAMYRTMKGDNTGGGGEEVPKDKDIATNPLEPELKMVHAAEHGLDKLNSTYGTSWTLEQLNDPNFEPK